MPRPPFHRFVRPVLVVLTLGLTLGCQTESRRPNVLLISLDTLRADHLSCYGYHRQTSPFLDELASRGVLFENAFVNTHGTPQSHATILSSQYQETHKVMFQFLKGGRRASGVPANPVPSRVVQLQEILRGHGYLTLGVTGGGYMAENFGFARGFAEFHDDRDGVQAGTGKLISMVQRHAQDDQPIFAFYHTYEIHMPYTPPEQYRTIFGQFKSKFVPTYENVKPLKNDASALTKDDLEAVEGMYDGGIRFVDDTLRRMFSALGEIGFLNNYIVVITSDHGEEFGEHGGLEHASTLYDELLRVPLIMAGSAVPAGRVDERMASSIDIVPTILSYAGIEVDIPFEGVDLLAAPRESKDEQAVVSQFGNLMYAIRTRSWKLIQNMSPASVELYDLRKDPTEQQNVAEAFPDVKRSLEDRLSGWRDRLKSSAADSGGVKLNQKQVERLRSLGYVEGVQQAGPGDKAAGGTGYSLRGTGSDESIVSSTGETIRIALGAMHGHVDALREQGGQVSIRGWASDRFHLHPAARVEVFVNGEANQAESTPWVRTDVAKRFDAPSLKKAGFAVDLPETVFTQIPPPVVRVFAISATGVASELRYRPHYECAGRKFRLGGR